jgi:dipeptidase E
MKLLLTSCGLANNSIIKALFELVQKPFAELKLAFIPTASNLESGDEWWLIKDLEACKKLGFLSIDIVDISALPKTVWQKRLEDSDIILVEGGNVYHLIYWFNKSGLSELVPELLKNKAYIGISAGSLVVTPSLINADFEKPTVQDIGEAIFDQGLSLVNFMIAPHINNSFFPEYTFENLEKQSKNYQYPIYGLDDNSAIKIDGNKVEVISEGEWKKFN